MKDNEETRETIIIQDETLTQFVITNGEKVLVTINPTTAEVTLSDGAKSAGEAAKIFWESLQLEGKSLSRRLRDALDLLQEARDQVVSGDLQGVIDDCLTSNESYRRPRFEQ